MRFLGRILLALLLALVIGLAIGTLLRMRMDRPVEYLGGLQATVEPIA